jgi:ABC-type branched-subunit amino acid transport system substrate-binding protein
MFLPKRWTSRLQTPARNLTERWRDSGIERPNHSIPLSLFLSICLLLLLAACSASTQPVVKIGLVAPFEGRYRPIGYEAIYAARLAIREINARGGIDGHRIELVALDDRGDPGKAIEAARQLVLDPQVVAVIGHLRPDSTDAAMPVYCEAGLPVIAIESALESAPSGCESAFIIGSAPRARWPEDRLIFVSNVHDPNGLAAAQDFVMKYNAIPIDGTRAGPIALQTYDAISLLFEAFLRAQGIDRAEVKAALSRINFKGLGATYAFDQQGKLIEPQTTVFEYDKDRQPQVVP